MTTTSSITAAPSPPSSAISRRRERALDRYLCDPIRSAAMPRPATAPTAFARLLDALPPRNSPGTPNWLSGRPLAEGIYYCPVSGAFQLPIDTIAGYKLKMSFQWDRNRLIAITTTFDDEKGSQSYHALGGPGDSQGNFFFAYVGSDPQVQVASTTKFDGPRYPARSARGA